MYQIAFPSLSEVEEKHRYCRLHIQIWTYIISGALVVSSILGITLGILLLVYSEWHEATVIYKQTLVYLRRANPLKYWFAYKIFAAVWIGLHCVLLLSIVANIFAIRYSRTYLLIPNLVACVLHMGVYLLLIAALIILSVTGSRTTWLSLSATMFFAIFVGIAIVVLSLYHRFLDEKAMEMKILMANTKSVHFKERKT